MKIRICKCNISSCDARVKCGSTQKHYLMMGFESWGGNGRQSCEALKNTETIWK